MKARRGVTTVVAFAALVVALAAMPSVASAASETCTAPSATAVDGYIGSTYLRLVSQTSSTDPNVTWVCFRAYGGAGLDKGGRINIAGAQAAPQLPTVDNNASACTSTTGNSVPPPHPMVAGQVGDPSDPATYLPFMLDAYSSGGTAWVCMSAGSTSKRIVVSTGGIAAPQVSTTLDSAGTPLPPAWTPPLGYASGSCQAGTAGVPTQLVNARFGSTNVWAYTAQGSGLRASVCLRVAGGGAPTIGGMLSVDLNSTPGITPVVLPTGVCDKGVAGLSSPVQAAVSRSTTTSPASICLDVIGIHEGLTVGTTGSLTVQPPNWQRDPDSAQ